MTTLMRQHEWEGWEQNGEGAQWPMVMDMVLDGRWSKVMTAKRGSYTFKRQAVTWIRITLMTFFFK